MCIRNYNIFIFSLPACSCSWVIIFNFFLEVLLDTTPGIKFHSELSESALTGFASETFYSGGKMVVQLRLSDDESNKNDKETTGLE